jgi:hypothetical protein
MATATRTAVVELPSPPAPKVECAKTMSLKDYHRRVKSNHRRLAGPAGERGRRGDSAARTAAYTIAVLVVVFGLLLGASAALGWP